MNVSIFAIIITLIFAGDHLHASAAYNGKPTLQAKQRWIQRKRGYGFKNAALSPASSNAHWRVADKEKVDAEPAVDPSKFPARFQAIVAQIRAMEHISPAIMQELDALRTALNQTQDAYTQEQITRLEIAAEKKHLELVKAQLALQEIPLWKDLQTLVFANNIDALNTFKTKYPKVLARLINVRHQEETLLHDAAAMGHYQVARWLLANGADCTADTQLRTPLFAAIGANQPFIVRLLLNQNTMNIAQMHPYSYSHIAQEAQHHGRFYDHTKAHQSTELRKSNSDTIIALFKAHEARNARKS